MLVIRRRAGQSICIGDGVEVEVIDASHGRVKLGITAPDEVRVLRKETRLTVDANLSSASEVGIPAIRALAARLRRRQETPEKAARASAPGGCVQGPSPAVDMPHDS